MKESYSFQFGRNWSQILKVIPSNPPKGDKELNAIKSMIEWLDGYAACYNADPFKIEKFVNKREDMENDEVSEAWTEVRQDVADIINLPDSSQEVIALQKKIRLYRPISAALVFATGLAVLLITGLHITLGRDILLVALISLFAIYSVVLFYWYRGNKRLYNMVRKYYNSNGGKVSKQKNHIKLQVQHLIDVLTLAIRTDRIDPEKHEIKLYHKEYSNIRILREETLKNTEKHVYICAVKARQPQA